ncbi:MAG: phosphatidylserine decarboxylase [Desulfomonile sp.]|nr:phosphatidylserine decarboxylase [Desulfomonile sp.]
MTKITHQYIKRETGEICEETFFGDKTVNLLYSVARENAPTLFRALTSARASSLLGFVNFDIPAPFACKSFCRRNRIDLSEALGPRSELDTLRKIFERKIRYWECRPMPRHAHAVVSPADSKVIVGSLAESSLLFIKEKFFHIAELLGLDKRQWTEALTDGDFAVFRLTPDKYHYNHAPVSGLVVDFYEIDGGYHSCNPSAIVAAVTPFSTNRRAVTIIDTDVPHGTGVGFVAMIEVAALMVGEIVQCFSTERYDNPMPVAPGTFLTKGSPKSLYRPGSSTDVLVFQQGRIKFASDLLENQVRGGVESRFTVGFGAPLVETEVAVRSLVAIPACSPPESIRYQRGD